MELKFNVIGNKRKELVKVISEVTGEKAVYKYMPTCAYEIGAFTVDKEGTLIFEATGDPGTIWAVLEALDAAGFTGEGEYTLPSEEPTPVEKEEAVDETSAETTEASEDAETVRATDAETVRATDAESDPTSTKPDTFSVSLPRFLFSDTALQNLSSLLDAKGALIKKALGIEALPVELTDEQIIFPWFTGLPSPEEVHAYTTFIAKLGEMARNAKRVTATEKEVANEKYAFRCFLLRLGFIGEEFKADRKILLKSLSGSAAFKSGKKKEVADENSLAPEGGEQE